MEAAMRGVAHRVQIELVNNRLCGAAIETRGCIAAGDTLYCGTQAPHHIRRYVCQELGIDEGRLRVVSQDMGGGFGYKGKHYPEETIVVWAARKLGIDCAEIRRRNLIPTSAMPYKTPVGPTYDCGDFPKVFERALQLSRYGEKRKPGRGIGIACYVESSGVAPSRLAGMMGAKVGFYESAQVRVAPDGSITAYLGTHNHGQGHATTYAQILSAQLGVPMERVAIVEGDTAVVPVGTGTFGSRSIAVGGSALHVAGAKIIAKGKRIAAHLLEAADRDIEFRDGAFSVVGTDRKLTFQAVAGAAYVPHNYPLAELEPGLDENAFYDPPSFAFSNGAHVCEVELDADTGVVRIVGYWAVDDIGTVINPMIVEGQLHGGLTQGIGQALGERTVYQEGQRLSASFMDYALPRAGDLPFFTSELDETQPCTHNPLGAKGCGESGAIAAPAAVINAVLDALAPHGVRELEMPATPHRIWQAIMRK